MSSNRTLRPIPLRRVDYHLLAFKLGPDVAILIIPYLPEAFLFAEVKRSGYAVPKLNRGSYENDDEDIKSHSFSLHVLNAAFSAFCRSCIAK
jgi:hypothetical protein